MDGDATNPFPGITLIDPPTLNEWHGVPVDPSEDLDGDGWSDAEELLRGSDPSDPQSTPDRTRDTDGDGVSDWDEDRLKTNPYDPKSTPDKEQVTDTDADGVSDADDPDDDNDGWLDVDEQAAGSDPKDATSIPADTDGDGLADYLDPDDDNDGHSDSDEVAASTDPLDPESKPTPPDPNAPANPADLPNPDAFKLPNFDGLSKKWDEGLSKLKNDASKKFPFGLGNPAKAFQTVSGDGSPCPPLQITFATIRGTTLGGEVDVCGTAMAKTSHDIIRPVLAWVLIGMTILACAKIASRS